MESKPGSEIKPIKLVYLIGTYPELTNTFIDREITTLRRLGGFQIQIMSIRSPRTIATCSAEQKALYRETQYLIPARWSSFNFAGFILANFYFMAANPILYFGTLFYLLSASRMKIKARMKNALYFWQGVYAAYLLRRTPFDHLHVHFMDRAVLVALVVGRFLKKPYSFTAHAADIYTHTASVREKIDNARFMVTVSRYNKQYLEETYPGIDSNKIHILHPWVDTAQFVPAPDRPVHPRVHILSVGRLVEKKGHIDLVEAAYLLHKKGVDAETRIIGEGPLHAELEERIAHYGLQERIHLLGGLPQEKVRDLLREWADIFALPCVIARNGDRDGMPVSLAEAMAMELPVISTNIIGIRELIQPGTGILIPAHNPAELADAIQTILQLDQAARAKMGKKGRAVIDAEFNLLKGTQELAHLFHTAIAGNAPAAEGIVLQASRQHHG